MPTPVSAARQCLTDEAARAIDDAVSVARRRSHPQTTSLHAVSALLTSASSALLREACARARSSAYSPRLQFRALELSVGVSLDRLPTCSTKTLAEPPPISNSLMAAIKRSQANQRRQPESFYLLQQQQQQQVTTSLFKVELKHLVLSILDDPIVSRVFGEAGFRSCDVKFAIIHPPVASTSSSSASRLLNTRCPPIFLCNLTDSDPGRKGFSFPFMGGGEDENCSRIGKVLVRKTGKNPLLIGVSANNALNCFVDCVPKGMKGGIGIDGLCVISIGNEVSEFVNKGGDKEKLDSKFREIGDLVKNCEGPGVVVNFGELKPLVDEDGVSVDGLSYLVSLFTDLLELYRDKLWLIGAAGSYETYMNLIARFPAIEKDLDLHLLPITSSRPSIPEFGSKTSLMGSFVPFGGFFSTSSDFKISLTGNNGFKNRCEMCNKKYVEEVSSLKRGCNVSIADQYSSTLPSWLQITENDLSKAKEDESIISAKIIGLQKKWDGICQTIHHTPQLPKPNIGQTRTDALSNEGFQISPDKNQKNSKDSPPSETRSATSSPFIDKDLSSPYKQDIHRPVASKASITSVTTDLGLGTLYASTHQESKNTKNENNETRLQNLPGSTSSISAKIDIKGKSNPCDLKSIWRELLEKVGRQEEAICTISETVSRLKNGEGKRGSSRGDIWLSFLGPDKVGKKQIASALTEVVFGTPKSLISFDLSFQDGIIQSNSIFYSQGYDNVKYRGKTVVDCIAEEIRKRPHSIVFLENMDKADPIAQSSLSHAIRTGKFPDSHGREISINNMIFVTTSNIAKGNHNLITQKAGIRLLEEVILEAKSWQMQILIRNMDESLLIGAEKEIPSFISNKRKLSDARNSTYQDVASEMQKHPQKFSRSYLDLNLPLSEMEDDISENSEEWLDEFFEQVDEKIVLRPFDFDALADKVLKEINKYFLKIFESGVRLEIENSAMVQIVAAAWVSDEKRAVEDWVDNVLRRSFIEARTRYYPTAQSEVKLMACEGILMKEQAPGICLPASIIIN